MTNNKNTIVMKTNYYNSEKMSIYTLFGLLTLMATSCGSYQNKSYYDRDGIYGSETEKVAQAATNDGQAKTTETNKYTDYFNSLRDGQTDEVFTDVEGYSSYKDTVASQERNQSSSWGSNPSNVTVNVYDNSWGYNGWNNYWYGNNWGWNNPAWNSWYGPNWGWGWNSWYGNSWGYNNYWYGGYYGYGYNNWCGNGYNNGYYGNNYNQNYAYGNGRRGSTYGRPEGNSSRDYRRSSNAITRSNTVTGTRRADYTPTRTTPTRNNTIRNNSTTPVRTYSGSNTTRDNSNSPTRTTTSPTRNNTYTPSNNSSNTTRSNTYTPSNNSNSSPTRSSSGGGNSGGGGTRSSGGGRR
jgi:hypothetical protein